MKKVIPILIIVLAFISVLPAVAQERTELVLKKGWKFAKGDFPGAEHPAFDDSGWEDVVVPHDWAIKGPFDPEIDKQTVAIIQNNEEIATEKTGRTGALPYIGTGWYRNRFELPENLDGKKVLIIFEGAMSEPEVFVNGKKVGEWGYGYSYFHFDITNNVTAGRENVLAVRLRNRGLSSRWYPGAGLYRKVTLSIQNRESIDQWGVQVTTPYITRSLAKVNVKTSVSGDGLRLVTQIVHPNGDTLAKHATNMHYGGTFDQNLPVEFPSFWSPETPVLYRAVSRLYKNGQLADQVVTNFGIRQISYKPDEGFRLNGEVRKFKGVCLHHDLGPIGTAVNRSALKRQLRILKDLGCDAIRSAHNMPSLEQLELCDEMGFMFIAESFDEWAKPKVDSGYHRFFDAYAEKDVTNLVRATRNHPCIVMWSAGNEVPDQWGPEGVKRARWLQEIFHREDPTRPVTVGMDQVKAVMESGFGALLDVPGLNYRVHLYEEAYERFPQGYILGSETASTVSSRGVYHFPVEKGKMVQHDDLQSSSYDLEYCSWSNLPEDDFILQDDKPWVIGEFVWTGFDYLGEPTPYDDKWPSRSSYFGICDLAGIPKDRYFLYRSRWNTEEETLHILPHWNWEGRIGEKTPVFVYTSYDKAELFVNGKSMGIRQKSTATPQDRYRLMWMDVAYEPGTIRVVAYDDKDRIAAQKEVHTAGQPAQLILEPDRTVLDADGEDIAFVTVSVLDENGVPCPTATNRLKFNVKGAGTFRAACNGDPTSLEMFHLPAMQLFSGKLVVLVQTSELPGEIELTVTGDGLEEGRVVLRSE